MPSAGFYALGYQQARRSRSANRPPPSLLRERDRMGSAFDVLHGPGKLANAVLHLVKMLVSAVDEVHVGPERVEASAYFQASR